MSYVGIHRLVVWNHVHVNRSTTFNNGNCKTQQVTAHARKYVTALLTCQNPKQGASLKWLTHLISNLFDDSIGQWKPCQTCGEMKGSSTTATKIRSGLPFRGEAKKSPSSTTVLPHQIEKYHQRRPCKEKQKKRCHSLHPRRPR